MKSEGHSQVDSMQTAVARLDALNRRLDNVEIALGRHRSHDVTMTSGGKRLLERSESLLTETRRALRQRWDRTLPLDNPIREQVRRNICDDFSAALRELAATLLPALDGATSSRVPVELEPVLQRLADSSAPTWTCQVLLYAAGAFNYSIEKHEDPVNSLVPNLGLAASGLATSTTFLFLRIPEVDRDSATLHTIVLGHELGHLRDWASHLVAALPVPEPSEWCDENGQLLLEHVSDYQRYSFIVRRWRSELAADIFAALIFGPAALNALSELIGNLAAWRLDFTTHPAADRRAAVTIKVLTDLGYSTLPALGRVFDHYREETLDALTRHAVASDLQSPDPAVELARNLVFTDIDTLIARCREEVLPNDQFGAARWDEVEVAADAFAAGVPFGEHLYAAVQDPVDDPVIVNAAWMVRNDRLHELGQVVGLDSSLSTDASQISAVLDALVLKSFEIAELRRTTGPIA